MIFATPAYGQANRVIERRMRSERQVLALRAGEPGGYLLQIPLTNVGKLAGGAALRGHPSQAARKRFSSTTSMPKPRG
jgi:hypothetical protein